MSSEIFSDQPKITSTDKVGTFKNKVGTFFNNATRVAILAGALNFTGVSNANAEPNADSANPGPTSTTAPVCKFTLGFGLIKEMIPDKVGDCKNDEHHNPINGDGLQETTGGLLVWRQADNWTAFTDGYRTWVNGPDGLQQRLNTERFSFEKEVQSALVTPIEKPPAVNFPPTPAYNPSDNVFVIRNDGDRDGYLNRLDWRRSQYDNVSKPFIADVGKLVGYRVENDSIVIVVDENKGDGGEREIKLELGADKKLGFGAGRKNWVPLYQTDSSSISEQALNYYFRIGDPITVQDYLGSKVSDGSNYRVTTWR